MTDLVDDYLSWLKSKLVLRSLEGGWAELTTPFLNHSNDHIQVYIKEVAQGKYLLSDNGDTLNELSLSGVELNSPYFIEQLNVIIKSNGLKLEKEQLVMETVKKDLPRSKHTFIQAVLAIDDLYVLARSRSGGTFSALVSDFFNVNNVFASKNILVAGESGLPHKFDYMMSPNRLHPERLIRLVGVPKPDRIKLTLFQFKDIQHDRQFEGIVFMNDEKPIKEDHLEAFGKYAIRPLKWSERTEWVAELQS